MNLALVIRKDTLDMLTKMRQQYDADTYDDTIRQLIQQAKR
jgi:hypothetical protein